jgi:hypothetical protein
MSPTEDERVAVAGGIINDGFSVEWCFKNASVMGASNTKGAIVKHNGVGGSNTSVDGRNISKGLVDHVCVATCLRDPPKDRHKDTRHDIKDKSRLQQDTWCPWGLSNDPSMSRRVASCRIVSHRLSLQWATVFSYANYAVNTTKMQWYCKLLAMFTHNEVPQVMGEASSFVTKYYY